MGFGDISIILDQIIHLENHDSHLDLVFMNRGKFQTICIVMIATIISKVAFELTKFLIKTWLLTSVDHSGGRSY